MAQHHFSLSTGEHEREVCVCVCERTGVKNKEHTEEERTGRELQSRTLCFIGSAIERNFGRSQTNSITWI